MELSHPCPKVICWSPFKPAVQPECVCCPTLHMTSMGGPGHSLAGENAGKRGGLQWQFLLTL